MASELSFCCHSTLYSKSASQSLGTTGRGKSCQNLNKTRGVWTTQEKSNFYEMALLIHSVCRSFTHSYMPNSFKNNIVMDGEMPLQTLKSCNSKIEKWTCSNQDPHTLFWKMELGCHSLGRLFSTLCLTTLPRTLFPTLPPTCPQLPSLFHTFSPWFNKAFWIDDYARKI